MKMAAPAVAAPVAVMDQQVDGAARRAGRVPNTIQVSLDRAPLFFARIGRRMMHGSEDAADGEKPTFDEVVITGLGMATKTAVGAASCLERDQQAFTKRVETAYFASELSGRRLPKISITMVKNPNAPPMPSPPPRAEAAPIKEEEH